MALPLAGVKVVEMAQVLFGPATAVYLADQGAEVIKVEPLRGDQIRYRHTSPYLEAHSLSKPFLALNRNKRGISLDVHERDGQEILHKLAGWADVFIHNFRPGSEAPFRLDYSTLSDLNPRLIYASVSAFGREGPDAHLAGYDVQVQARSGVLAMRRTPEGVPIPSAVNFADMSGCISLAFAIMLALWQREQTGRGQMIETSLLNAALAVQMQHLVWIEGDDSPLPGQAPTALYTCYECSDGRWLNLVVVEDHQWMALLTALDLAHLAQEEGIGSEEQRGRMSFALYQVLDGVFRTAPLDHWLAALQGAGVPCAAVQERSELLQDRQVKENRMIFDQTDPRLGVVTMVAPPYHLSASRGDTRIRREAPSLGQHTTAVLSELGYDREAIDALRSRNVIR